MMKLNIKLKLETRNHYIHKSSITDKRFVLIDKWLCYLLIYGFFKIFFLNSSILYKYYLHINIIMCTAIRLFDIKYFSGYIDKWINTAINTYLSDELFCFPKSNFNNYLEVKKKCWRQFVFF